MTTQTQPEARGRRLVSTLEAVAQRRESPRSAEGFDFARWGAGWAGQRGRAARAPLTPRRYPRRGG